MQLTLSRVRVAPKWRPWLVSLGLFLLNAYICRELFAVEFVQNLDSNEGAFTSLIRFYREHAFVQWFPWFNAGMPIENAYQPLFPMAGALISLVTGLNAPRSLHLLLALLYCLGPITLFWFAWDWSKNWVLSCGAALAYSLLSPAEAFIPVLVLQKEGFWGPLRLYNLVHYAEDPHNLALTLFPLALLFLRRAVVTRTAGSIIGAIVFSAGVVMTNAFGAFDLAIGGIGIVLATGGGFWVLAGVGVAAYLWMCPWLPPSMIDLIRHDQWGDGGVMHQSAVAPWVAAGCFVFVVLAVRRLKSPVERFAILFAYWLCLIPVGFFLYKVTLVPQSWRYQLELELAVCLLLGVVLARAVQHSHRWVTVALIVCVVIAGGRQAKHFRRFARGLIVPIDITQTIQYKTCMWLDRNMQGQRAMVSGDTEYICNVYSNNPQLSSGHAPSAPNWFQQIAVYVVYTGTPTSEGDAEIPILWLKAFGVHAITVPGAKSREFYPPVLIPHRFDGVLPVLWHEEDDTIFEVPQRTKELVRIVPREAIVKKAPIHGLDVDPLRPYVAALDDASLPLAKVEWDGFARGVVRAEMKPGQVVSVQINYAPGWRASVGGREVPVVKDAIGLMMVDPRCDGPCAVELRYGPTPEAWVCRMLSGLATFGMLLLLLKPGTFSGVRREPRLRQLPR